MVRTPYINDLISGTHIWNDYSTITPCGWFNKVKVKTNMDYFTNLGYFFILTYFFMGDNGGNRFILSSDNDDLVFLLFLHEV